MALVFAALLILIGLVPRPAVAQVASLRGTFADSTTNAPIAAVRVRLRAVGDTARALETRSADDGSFTLAGIPSGAWRLEAERLGYAVWRRTLVLGPGDRD